jgi:hypothetical protein
VVFKSHLDLGFTDLASRVLHRYLDDYFPQAMATARALRESEGSERLIWTTGSWLVHTYLEQATPEARVLLEAAIAAGDIVWHAMPFTTHSELMDASLFRYGLSLAQGLDQRYGKTTIAAKLTDVPGHTRGIVPLLAAAGITLLHIGVNPASTVPDVPPLFRWRDPQSGSDIMVMYQAGSYGETVCVPGFRHALAFIHAGDNHGPPEAAEVRAIFQKLRASFPQATVAASSLNAFAAQLHEIKASLPLVEAEIGDSWIHGAGSDPQKVSQFRALSRLRSDWIEAGRMLAGAPVYERFSTALLQVAEHTWGLDVKTYLPDQAHYATVDLPRLRASSAGQLLEASWSEQRDYLREALAALQGTPFATESAVALALTVPHHPNLVGWQQLHGWDQSYETAHFVLAFDPQRGALNSLQDRRSGRQWAAPTCLLGAIHYEVFSQADYDRFWEEYIVNKDEVAPWAIPDFTKPGMAAAGPHAHRNWWPSVVAAYQREDAEGHYWLMLLRPPEEATAGFGCPRLFTLEVRAPHGRPRLEIELQWFDKAACRLPEALWFAFSPLTAPKGDWQYETLGQWIEPEEVVRNGGRGLHAVGRGVRYRDQQGQLWIETLDAPLVAPGKPALLRMQNTAVTLEGGVHINLYNNVWGTNFPMWYDDNARFRFIAKSKIIDPSLTGQKAL